MVAAYYLAALLRRERAAGPAGNVVGVAVQQQGQGNPMDDVVVDFDESGKKSTLGLQIKRSVTVSAADKDFQAIVRAAVATQALRTFKANADKTGFVVANVANEASQNLHRLIDWAKDSPVAQDFENRFAATGAASAAVRAMRENLKPLIGARNLEAEVNFYRHFTAIEMNNLAEGAAGRAEILNRLNEAVASNQDGQNVLLFDRLCQIARDGAATGARWTRETLLAQLHGKVRLRVTANLVPDIERLNAFSLEGLRDVSETIDGFHVERAAVQGLIREQLEKHRLVSISGLPGCGKSAALKHFAQEAAERGPILFLKSDRIEATGWTAFATALGLQHTVLPDLLAEIGSAGTPVLFIDGIDRVRVDRRGVITDILKTIESDPSLSQWKVLASSRDQGLETYSAWFPLSFYKLTGIGDVQVEGFSDDEAEVLAKTKPNLRKVLFGNQAVQQIARRPFFAAVLARTIPETSEPQTEVDLINAWWERAGHHADTDDIPLRKRALLDIAEKGARNLGKSIVARDLKDATHAQLEALKDDYIIRYERGGANIAFTHDIFFEWSFFRLLIDFGDAWTSALELAGEPPLLGRVVGLLAQENLARPGEWTKSYAALAASNLRAQWRREWLTAPPFTSALSARLDEFAALVMADDWALFEKLLVWFQAQHTIPSPVILAQPPVDGVDKVRVADLLGWPSDTTAWGRLIDWILTIADQLPVRLIPQVLEVFGVWQNILSGYKNARSAAILKQADAWLRAWEDGTLTGEGKKEGYRFFRRDARSQLAKALRQIILISARSYPDYAKGIFERALKDEEMRSGIFDDVMAFAPFMASVAPELLAQFAKEEILEELPQDRIDREEREREESHRAREAIRKIPEAQRTEDQKRALQFSSFAFGIDRVSLDDVGISRHSNFYFPESPVREPFASLFARKPDVAIGLVRDLCNHAMEGWRQVHAFNKQQMGTPVPVTVEFPWGKQQFWGDWHVYSWGQGQLAPHALECGLLALTHWAFKELEAGRTASETIQKIVQGNECYGVLGIALTLALEKWEVSETTLAIVTCQRLWQHDIARVVNEPMKNLDILGFGRPSELNSAQLQGQAFLESRESRKREIRWFAMLFALSGDAAIADKFKAALARFPDELPYTVEEQRGSEEVTQHLREEAERLAGLGDKANYHDAPAPEGQKAVAYQPPKPFTPAQEKRLQESTQTLTGYSVMSRATKALEENAMSGDLSLADAVAYARKYDTPDLFKVRSSGGSGPEQAAVASVAACVVRFGDPVSDDAKWAWGVFDRVEKMPEPEGEFHGARITWHPATRLAMALRHDRQAEKPRPDTSERLLRVAAHPMECVNEFGFTALFLDADEHLRWVAGQLAFDFCIHYRGDFKQGRWDPSKNEAARSESLARAIKRLKTGAYEPMPVLPPPWVKGAKGGRRRVPEDEWQAPEPSFEPSILKNVMRHIPFEAWMGSEKYRPFAEKFVLELVAWSIASILPPWRDDKKRNDRRTDLFEWLHMLADLIARVAPMFDAAVAKEKLVTPFLVDDEEALSVLARFADRTICRYVMDAKDIPANTLPLLQLCATRVITDRTFEPGGYRGGKIYGHELPELIRALLLVAVGNAPAAERFANGDYSQIGVVMPIIDEIVSKAGWSTFVMQNYLTLCERAGTQFPVKDFARQANAALALIGHSEDKWTGTWLPARLAGVVQKLADHNFPLQQDDALDLLKVLDALIDLGDRRSAALEQTEAFKGVQARKAA